jgi:hypothetical protein
MADKAMVNIDAEVDFSHDLDQVLFDTLTIMCLKILVVQI